MMFVTVVKMTEEAKKKEEDLTREEDKKKDTKTKSLQGGMRQAKVPILKRAQNMEETTITRKDMKTEPIVWFTEKT